MESLHDTRGTAIGLRFTGLADDIMNLVFGQILGTVASALAFRLGGRDGAGQAVKRMLGDIKPAPGPATSASSRAIDFWIVR